MGLGQVRTIRTHVYVFGRLHYLRLWVQVVRTVAAQQRDVQDLGEKRRFESGPTESFFDSKVNNFFN
jgi:hypothetical protein